MSDDKPKLRLFVWDRFCPDYTSGLAVVIAENIEVAQSLLAEQCGYRADDWGRAKEYSLDERNAFHVFGGG